MKQLTILTIAILFSTFVALSLSASSNYTDSTYISYITCADSAIAKNNWELAEQSLIEAMRSNPSNPTNVMLLSNLALIQFQQGKDSIALASINEANIIAPNSITILSNRARILKSMGKIDDAYSDYSMILSIDSSLIEPRYMHGIIALSKSDFTTAQDDFLTLEQVAPNSPITFEALATFYFYTHQFEKAIPYYSKLLKYETSIEALINRATCYLTTNQLSEASADISEGLKVAPNNGEFYLLRTWLNRLFYRFDDAKKDAQKAIELGIPINRVNAALQQ